MARAIGSTDLTQNPLSLATQAAAARAAFMNARAQAAGSSGQDLTISPSQDLASTVATGFQQIQSAVNSLANRIRALGAAPTNTTARPGVLRIHAGHITAGTIDAGVVNVVNLNANNLTSGAINAAVIAVTNINASNINSGTLSAGRIAAGSIDATKVNIRQILVGGLTLTNNSPSAGNIAWSSCTVYYDGSAYAVSSGNTTSGHGFVYWTVGSGTFTEAATFTPGSTTFLIATNTAGAADVAWNKLASGGVVASHLNLPTTLVGPNGSLTVSVTFTNNSPGAGSVGWGAGTVTYRGVTYNIAAGSTGANTWIYWQLGNPTVIQSASSYPTLGVDDFLIGLNDFNSGAATSLGLFAPVLEIHNGINERTYIIAGSIVHYNSEGRPLVNLRRSAVDVPGTPAAGVLNLFNGSSTSATLTLTGSDGKVQLNDLEWTHAPQNNGTISPSLVNYQQVIFAGVTYYIALYQ
jgi:hypothetical protein